MIRSYQKKITWEDKFARHCYCNSARFLPYMKKQTRKKARRLLKDINFL